jgi:hypothetical protein
VKYLTGPIDEARAIERALFARHCRALGVRPADVYAGTATLDRSAATGEPVFPPITTTGAHVIEDGDSALLFVEPYVEALDRQRVEGKRLDLASRVEADALPERWRTKVSLG